MTDDELDRDDSRQRDSSLRSVHHSSNRSNNGEGNSLSPSLSLSVPENLSQYGLFNEQDAVNR